jgi:hypothetical protein
MHRALCGLLLLVAPPVWAADGGPADADLGLAATAADAPTVTARADRAEARVGDVVRLSITAVGLLGTPVILPENIDLQPFTELERSLEEKDLGDGKMRREFRLKIAAYEPGEVHVPAVAVTYFGKGGQVLTAHTQPIPFKITSLLANEAEPALKDNAAPVTVIQRDYLPVYVLGGLAAACLGALLALLVRRRLRGRAARAPAPPPRPAHEVALERLDRLGATLAATTELRPFVFELSEIIREYLGARFGFDSLELTTEELVLRLRRRVPVQELRGFVLTEVEGWLSGCDLVKFAKIAPTPDQARGALETAIRIVEASRPRPEPALADAAAAAAPAPPRQEAAGG